LKIISININQQTDEEDYKSEKSHEEISLFTRFLNTCHDAIIFLKEI
jgi:hypothetical protein